GGAASKRSQLAGQVRTALESHRSNSALMPLLSEPFLRRMEIFAAALALWGAKINLTARPQDHAEIAFHIVDSLMPLALDLQHPARSYADTVGPTSNWFAAGRHILDFGSGGGFPGVVLASACPARFTLAEARHKRASFLKVVVAEMALDNVEILATRLDAA